MISPLNNKQVLTLEQIKKDKRIQRNKKRIRKLKIFFKKLNYKAGRKILITSLPFIFFWLTSNCFNIAKYSPNQTILKGLFIILTTIFIIFTALSVLFWISIFIIDETFETEYKYGYELNEER